MASLTLPSDVADDALACVPEDALSPETEERVREICDALNGHQHSAGCKPMCLATAAIYSAAVAFNDASNSDVKITQETVSEWCGVSHGVVRDHYKPVMAAWAEINVDDLDERERVTYSRRWGAEIGYED